MAGQRDHADEYQGLDGLQKIGRYVFQEKQKHGKIYINVFESDMITEVLR